MELMTPEELKELRAAKKALINAWMAPGRTDMEAVGAATEKLRGLLKPALAANAAREAVDRTEAARRVGSTSQMKRRLQQLAAELESDEQRLEKARKRNLMLIRQIKRVKEIRLKRLHDKNRAPSSRSKVRGVPPDGSNGRGLYPTPLTPSDLRPSAPR